MTDTDNLKWNKKLDKKLIRKLLSNSKKYRLHLMLCIVMVLFVAAVNISTPYIIKIAIDDIINPKIKKIMVYDKPNFATFEYNGEHYTVLRSFIEPKKILNYISDSNENNDRHYLVSGDIKLDSDFKIQNNGGIMTLKSGNNSYVIKPVDLVFKNLERANGIKALGILSGLFAILTVLSFILSYFCFLLMNYVSQNIIYEVRNGLYAHLIKLDLKKFQENPVGKLVTRITSDVENINKLYTDVMIMSTKDIVMIIGTIAVMFSMDYKITLIAVSVLSIFVFAVAAFRKAIREVQDKIRVQISNIISKLNEYIQGMRIIQVFGAEKIFFEDYKNDNLKFKELTLRRIKIYGYFMPLASFLSDLTLILLIMYCSPKVMNYGLEIGVMVAFVRYTRQLYQPISQFSEKYATFQQALSSAQKIVELENMHNLIKDSPNPISANNIEGDIEFKDVYFSYEEDYVLKGVSFDVQKYQKIGIVGATGSGKSTIINMISRFYDVERGSILIDGVDIREYDKIELRKNIGMVLQDVYLFSKTIYDNIRLYDENITDLEIEEACKLVGAHEFISKLDNGYNHILAEKGKELSVGQRALIAFARAICIKPKIIILDEATANIDTQSELIIQRAIENMDYKCTMIVIAHRLSTIQNSDKIIVLEKGHIKEVGNHTELIKKRGIYYNLYSMVHS